VQYRAMSHSPESAFTRWLKKYRYINISLIYLGTALVVIHFAEAVVYGLHMPDITFSLIVVLALAGLPIVLLIAWAMGYKKEETNEEVSIAKPVKRNWIKIIAASVVSVSLFAAAIFVYNKFFYHSKFTGKEKSIAVLPFASMNGDKETESFSMGISAEITNQLSRIGSLNVRASTSTIRFKDEKIKTLKDIAAELNVAAIVTGQFQIVSNKIRVYVALTDVNSDKVIWSKDYPSDWRDIFSIQNEIAEQVAFELNTEMTKDEKKKIEQKPTNSPEAYKYYLQGYELQNHFWETRKVKYFDNSRAMFQKALALDSGYVLAHAGLADLYNTYTSVLKRDSMMLQLQVQEIEKAWQIDSTNDYVNNVMGSIEQVAKGDNEKAFIYYKKAVEINPNSPVNLWGLAVLMGGNLGLFEDAKLLLDRTIQLDPLRANNFSMRGACNFYLNKQEEAMNDLETSIRLEPNFFWGMDQLGQIYASLGRLNEAKKTIELSLQLNPLTDVHWIPGLAYVYAKLGNKKKALELAPDNWNNWNALLALGMKEEALKAMPFYDENKKDMNTPYLIFKSQLGNKDYDQVRTDPRFLKIMERSKKQYEENKKKFSIAGILN
jgi:TolB-like protein/Tfp pilus assembly protein PilF